jgi:hypothetical protein
MPIDIQLYPLLFGIFTDHQIYKPTSKDDTFFPHYVNIEFSALQGYRYVYKMFYECCWYKYIVCSVYNGEFLHDYLIPMKFTVNIPGFFRVYIGI